MMLATLAISLSALSGPMNVAADNAAESPRSNHKIQMTAATASTTTLAMNVVPTPGAAVLMGLGGIVLVHGRRRS